MHAKEQIQDKTKESLPLWDLRDFYEGINSPQINKDFGLLELKADEFTKNYRTKIKQLSGEQLYQAVKEYETMQDLIGKLHSYAFLSYVTAVNEPELQAFLKNTESKINDITSKIIFFTLELNLLSDHEIEEKLNFEQLQFYKPWIRDIRVWRKYQLSEPEEKILHEKWLTSTNAWVTFFDQYCAKLQFKLNGKKLNLSEILSKLSSIDENKRKSAAKSIHKTLKQHIHIFTYITNTLVKDKEMDDKRRGFRHSISSRNLANLIEDEVVETLIQSVKENYPKLSHRYYKIKAKLMKKQYLNYWDRNAPISAEQDSHINWVEAVKIVQAAYDKFSPKIGEIIKQFFDNNWIDVPVKNGKRHGAFSHPTVPSVHPYIMLNYEYRPRDVMTLAHELGHGVHQMLAREQGVLICDTPLTLAETASVFGEQLAFRELLAREKDARKRKLLIANKVEDMLNTVTRQIALCSFEKKLHEERKKGELDAKQISKIWFNTQKESLGDAIKFDSSYSHFWAYIPHLIHAPFYVYAYAFGDCLVNSLYAVYEQGKIPDFEHKYIEMLKAGGKYLYKELLAPFGLNPSETSFWQFGLDKISSLIDELED